MKKRISIIMATAILLTILAFSFSSVLTVSAADTYLRLGEVKRTLIQSKNSVADVFTSSEGHSLPYRLYVPDDYDPEKSYPLVLFFHGAGERGTDNNHLFNGGSILQRLLMPSERENHPCLILAPQCPTDSQWVLSDWGPGTYDHTQIQKSPYMTAAEELLDHVTETYAVDTSALYVSGLSMGGYGTWDLIARHPDKFAAAIPVCGGIDPAYMESLKGFPIRTFHAKDDPVVNYVGTSMANGSLKDHGDFLYTEYETGGHLIWDMAYASDGLTDWLFAQRTDAATETETQTETETETQSETVSESITDSDTLAESETVTESETLAETATESTTDSEMTTDADSETDTNAETVTISETESVTAPAGSTEESGCASTLGFSAIALLAAGCILCSRRVRCSDD